MDNKLTIFLVVVTMLLGAFAIPAVASVTYRYGFDCVTTLNTRVSDQQIGEDQLFVDVSYAGIDDDGYSQVLFTFGNEGPDLASICAIYFDDGTLHEMSSIYDSSTGVVYTLGSSSPPDLIDPDHILDPEFEVTADFLCDSDPDTIDNGVNTGEWISILFTLKDGKTFEDTIAALDGGADGIGDDLRIGLFVLGIGLPDSDSSSGNVWGQECYVNSTTSTIIPAPGAVLLGSIGVGLVGWLRRRRTL